MSRARHGRRAASTDAVGAAGPTAAAGATSSWVTTPTRTVDAGGRRFAYRELGPAQDVPVVLFTHLAATLDNWDPRVVDALAAHRRVIAFDNAGVGGSTGTTPDTIEAMAHDAHGFLSALGLSSIDVLGLSMGGMVAQDLALAHPGLVRRLVLAGTGPRGGAGIDKVARVTYYDTLRAALTRSDPKEFLFFPRNATGKAAATAFLRRLAERTADRDAAISVKAFRHQLKAVVRFGRSAPSDLSRLTVPTLVVNGDHDRMVPTALSHDLHRRIADSELVIYPDAGHGSIFQAHEQFSRLAVDFFTRT